MSYREHLLTLFRSQAQVASLQADQLLKFPDVTLVNFFAFQLRRYPGFDGVPPRLQLGVLSTKEFGAVLNGATELGPISIEGIKLPKEAEVQLIRDAETCRAELLKEGAAEFPNLVDLRIALNSMDRRVLTDSMGTAIDGTHHVRSPLIRKFIEEIQG